MIPCISTLRIPGVPGELSFAAAGLASLHELTKRSACDPFHWWAVARNRVRNSLTHLALVKTVRK